MGSRHLHIMINAVLLFGPWSVGGVRIFSLGEECALVKKALFGPGSVTFWRREPSWDAETYSGGAGTRIQRGWWIERKVSEVTGTIRRGRRSRGLVGALVLDQGHSSLFVP